MSAPLWVLDPRGTADAHRAADQACGRAWECDCAACRQMRDEKVPTPNPLAALDYAVRVVLPAILRGERDIANADRIAALAPITTDQDAFEIACVLEFTTVARYASTSLYVQAAMQNAQAACEMAAGERIDRGDFDREFHVATVWSCARHTLPTTIMDELRAGVAGVGV